MLGPPPLSPACPSRRRRERASDRSAFARTQPLLVLRAIAKERTRASDVEPCTIQAQGINRELRRNDGVRPLQRQRSPVKLSRQLFQLREIREDIQISSRNHELDAVAKNEPLGRTGG